MTAAPATPPRRRSLGTLVGLAVVVVLAGCAGGPAGQGVGPAPSSPPPPEVSAAPPVAAEPGPPPAPSPPPPAPSPPAAVGASPAATVGPGAGLPGPLSPGAISPAVTQGNIHSTICVSGYTATVRPPASYTTALKIRQMASLGLPGPTSLYEEDHRVPLEVGGDPTAEANLWPEDRLGLPGAAQKDELENYVHAEVCAGRITLAEGQQEFLGNWETAYCAARLSRCRDGVTFQ